MLCPLRSLKRRWPGASAPGTMERIKQCQQVIEKDRKAKDLVLGADQGIAPAAISRDTRMRSQAEGLAEEPAAVPGVVKTPKMVSGVDSGVVQPPIVNSVLLV